jgi:hypothetical protein
MAVLLEGGFVERAGRVELRDLQLGRLLDAPCPVCPLATILPRNSAQIK